MPPTSAPLAADLESTAELPVLDPAADLAQQAEQGEQAEPVDVHHTETWIVPRVAPAALPDPATDEARARLETSLRKAYEELRDTEELLAVRDERIRQLQDSLQDAHETAEQQLAQLRAVHEEFAAAAAQHRAELDAGQQSASAAAGQRANELSNELTQAHGLLNAVTAHAAQLQQALDAREAEGRARESAALERRQALVASERAHASTLRDLNAERERNALCLESLHRAESHRQIFHSVVSDLQREVDEHESSLSRLRAELARRDAAPLVTQLPAAATAGPPAAERAPPAAAHADIVAAVEVTLAPEAPQVRQADRDASAARTRELEADLRAAEETINRLESQARGRGARLEELEKANRQWRLTMEEARATSTDTGATNAALRAAVAPHQTQARHETHGSEPEPLPEGATRLLLCKEKGREIVHVLGRKTSVGRTPDNDLQIDAKFISRHHAVILAGPVHTVIEDLNSTNGVLVNGKRVTRQLLKDGDDVVFGRTHYRFAVRRAGERR